mmetsp:Transcript_24613/g.24203  ORF Transcript_24613/g.24203 Transcript_24613/m.24203 type:complete len:203 (-) Transcript_24613:856-1464(-)
MDVIGGDGFELFGLDLVVPIHQLIGPLVDGVEGDHHVLRGVQRGPVEVHHLGPLDGHHRVPLDVLELPARVSPEALPPSKHQPYTLDCETALICDGHRPFVAFAVFLELGGDLHDSPNTLEDPDYVHHPLPGVVLDVGQATEAVGQLVDGVIVTDLNDLRVLVEGDAEVVLDRREVLLVQPHAPPRHQVDLHNDHFHLHSLP